MKRLSLLLASAACVCACAQQIEFAKERKATVKRYRFVGNHREESMWSALYGAKSGKIYIGLCTHAEAAHFYEFDPATETMRHIVDLTKLHGERALPVLCTQYFILSQFCRPLWRAPSRLSSRRSGRRR